MDGKPGFCDEVWDYDDDTGCTTLCAFRLICPGAGAKPLTEIQPGLLEALDELVNPETRGNPMSLLRWTSKSTATWPRT